MDLNLAKAPAAFPRFARHINLLVTGPGPQELGLPCAPAWRTLDGVLDRFAHIGTDQQLADAIFDDRLHQPGPARISVLAGANPGVEQYAHAWARSHGLAALPVATTPLRLLHADVVIALGDGAATNAVLDAAADMGTATLWIAADGGLRELIPSGDDACHGKATFSTPLADALTAAVRRWFNPLAQAETADPQLAALRHYADERSARASRERTAGLLDRIFCTVLTAEWGRWRQRLTLDPTRPDWGMPAALPVPVTLLARFAWSDVRANIASGCHRSGVWLLYLLAALAVFAAVAGATSGGEAGPGWQHMLWPAMELLALWTILALVWRVQRKDWHRRWLGHRYLAEQLRALVMSQSFPGVTEALATPLFQRAPTGEPALLRSAEAWLLRRTLSTEGVLPQPAALATSSLAAVVEGQQHYHRQRVLLMTALHSRLHCAAQVVFAMSLVGVMFHLFTAAVTGRHDTHQLLFLTAFLPAFAAALHGIQNKLEIGHIQTMSTLAAGELEQIRQMLESNIDDGTAPLCVQQAARRTARVMADEIRAWRQLVGEQQPELPA